LGFTNEKCFIVADAFNLVQVMIAACMGTISIATIVLASRAVCCGGPTFQGTVFSNQPGNNIFD
jgi:hypothetical protein